MRDILSKMAAKETNVDVKVGVKVWRVTGCHEFLAALGKYCKTGLMSNISSSPLTRSTI